MKKKIWILTISIGLVILACVVGYFNYTSITLKNGEYQINEDSVAEIDLNKKIASNCNVAITLEKQPDHGRIGGIPPKIRYIPDQDYFGQDQFKFSASCLFRKSHPATIDLQIHPVNDRPVVTGQMIKIPEDTATPVKLDGTDRDHDKLSYEIVEQPGHGTLSGTIPELNYQPDEDYYGSDYFSYRASDGQSESETKRIRIEITPVNDPPVADNLEVKTFSNIPVKIKLKMFDPENDKLTLKIDEPPVYGFIKGKLPELFYYPKKGFQGAERVGYRLFDGQAYSDSATIRIEVTKLVEIADLKKAVKKLVKKGGIAVGSLKNPDLIYNNRLFVPASLLKLATAAAALYTIGPAFRFQTEFYLGGKDDLYIKGYGDPILSTGDWRKIIAVLQKKKRFKDSLNNIILDDTAFEPNADFDGRAESIQYFDAPIGALATDQNTAKIRVLADRSITAWHHESIITDMVKKAARGLPRGYQYLTIAKNAPEGTRYTGELVKNLLEDAGISVEGKILFQSIPSNLKPIYIHDSSLNLKDIVREMLETSSNFMANQLLMTMAIHEYGEPARLTKGVRLLSRFLTRKVGLRKDDFTVVEGSGLSRKNRFSLMAMFKLINYFKTYQSLMPELARSKFNDLAAIGRKSHLLAKTGTLTDVSTIAGFIPIGNKKWKPFVIMLETGESERFDVLELLTQFYQKKE